MPACSPPRSISGSNPRGYERPDHPLQVMIAGIISETCGVRLERDGMGVDGCSVPTWSLPLGALARGFARLGSGEGLGARTGCRRGETVRGLFRRAGAGGGRGAVRHHRHACAGAGAVRQRRRRRRALRVAAGAWTRRRAQGRRRRQARRGAGARRGARRVSARGAHRRWPSNSTARSSIGAASGSDRWWRAKL